MKRKRVEDDEEEAKRKGTERTVARGGKRRVVGRCNPQNQVVALSCRPPSYILICAISIHNCLVVFNKWCSLGHVASFYWQHVFFHKKCEHRCLLCHLSISPPLTAPFSCPLLLFYPPIISGKIILEKCFSHTQNLINTRIKKDK